MDATRAAALVALVLTGALLTACQVAGPRPIATERATTTPATTSPENTSWHVSGRSRLDLDGDGELDEVRLRKRPGLRPPYPIQLVAELGTGPLAALIREHHAFPAFVGAADIDRRAGQEVFLLEEGPPRTITVFTWREGALVELTAPADQPITDDYVDQHASAYFTRHGSLWTTRSVERFGFGYDTVTTPDRYRVRVWRWKVVGTLLVPEARGVSCVSAGRQTVLEPC